MASYSATAETRVASDSPLFTAEEPPLSAWVGLASLLASLNRACHSTQRVKGESLESPLPLLVQRQNAKTAVTRRAHPIAVAAMAPLLVAKELLELAPLLELTPDAAEGACVGLKRSQ